MAGILSTSETLTQQSSLSSDTNAYEALAYFALRPELYFDAVADVKPTHQTHKGAAVIFTIYSDLSAITSSLSETADVDSVAMSDSQVTLTLTEYGNAILTTAKMRATSFLEIDSDAANLIGFNAGISIDGLAVTVLKAGTNVLYAGQATSRNTVIPTDKLTANDVRKQLAALRRANSMPVMGGMYAAYIHPDVSYDLRGETGAAAWRDPHTYSAPENIWNGEIGAFESFRFIETPRAPIFADCGSSTTATDVYVTLFCGRQALAKAHALGDGYQDLPTIVRGPVIDKLQRFHPIGWKWLGQYGRFREASLRRTESASTIGSNSSAGSN